MKIIITGSLLLLCSVVVAQNEDCKSNLSIFAESSKVKNYGVAYAPWKKVYDSCPSLNSATYIYGRKIMLSKIKKSTGADQKQQIKLLEEVYKKGHQYFPKKISLADKNINTALLNYDYKLTGKEEIYNLLKEAMDKDAKHFKQPKAMYLYFAVLVDLHKKGSRNLQQVFDTYDQVIEKISSIDEEADTYVSNVMKKEQAGTISSKEKKKKAYYLKIQKIYQKISENVDAKMGSLADCENLIPLYSKSFEAKKNDVTWLKRATFRMDEKGCTSDPLFVKVVEALHGIEPSAKSAYYVGVLKDKQNKPQEAIKYYQEAISLQTDKIKKAKIMLKIAAKLKAKGQKKSAYKYANNALKNAPALGEAYLLLSSIYADCANECGSTTFEKLAMNWKAAEVAAKAGKVKPALKAKANKIASSYRKRAPKKSDIFDSGMGGKTIKFNCWIGGSIVVPKLK